MAPEPDHEERLLVSKARAAELLSISIDTFERLVMPEVRTVRIGRRVLFAVPDLAGWVDEHAAFQLLAELPHERSRRRRDPCQGRTLGPSTARPRGAMVQRTTTRRGGAGLSPAPRP
jgi:hypothetical protein